MKRTFARILVPVFLFGLMACGGGSSSSSSSSTSSSSSSSGSTGSGSSGTALQGLTTCAAHSGAGVICGTLYAADGTTPIANATISKSATSADVSALKDLTANTAACKTDDLGAFACEVSACSGTTTFEISAEMLGTAVSFSDTCELGQVTQVAVSKTTLKASDTAGIKWLVVPGQYDGVQLLLSKLKGCTLTGDESTPATLSASSDCEAAGLTVLADADVETFLTTHTLSDYQAIFANCGVADYTGTAAITSAVQNYVDGGGNMYFSDLADTWLTVLFPSLVTFPVTANDTNEGTLTATVKDAGLQVFLGSVATPKTSISIDFNLPIWTAMDSVASGWTTYIEGDVSTLSSTLTGTRPITVGGPEKSGCVFYTSYHTEPSSTGTDQEKALKYLVVNRMSNCK